MLKDKTMMKSRSWSLAQFRDNIDGNISVMFAGSLSVLLLGITAAVDVTTTLSMKSKMQNALDNAVLSAAINADASNFMEFGEQSYSVNFADGGLQDTTLMFHKRHSGAANEMVGVATGTSPLLFSNLIRKNGYDISVRSVAKVNVTNTASAAAPTCIAALDKTASPAMIINSGASITATGCEIHVHSDPTSQYASAMNINAGINIDVAKTCVAGSRVTDNSNGQIGNLELDCDVTGDPFENKFPEPSDVSCDHQWGNYDNAPGNQITMQPGVYCGWHNFNNSNIDINFEPGLYVIKNGGWNVNGGNWEGSGVTFYMYDNSLLNFNSNVNANFTAPDSGDYEGAFLLERPNLPIRDYNLNSASNFNFEGAVYLPSKRLTVNSGANMIIRKTQIVANKIIVNGTLGIDSTAINPLTTVESEEIVTPYLAE